MQVFGGAVSTPVCGNGVRSRGSELVPQGSGRATLFDFSKTFFGKTYRLATIHTLQTDRQTDTTSCHKHDR